MGRLRIGVLASHEGTMLQAVIDGCARGDIDGEVSVVISNNSGSGALRRARSAGIPVAHLSTNTHPDPTALDRAIRDRLQGVSVELVILAGYMKKVGPATLHAFRARILNTHPALLPKFGGQGMYGMNVHQAVLEAGEEVSGASVFMVTEDYDAGPVVAQTSVPVLGHDTPESLAERVKEVERSLLVAVAAKVASRSLSI